MALLGTGETIKSVVAGSAAHFRSGPFKAADGSTIDFSTGWTITLYYAGPDCEEQSISATGDANGYLEKVMAMPTDEGLYQARLHATDGTTPRDSELMRVRVVGRLEGTD